MSSWISNLRIRVRLLLLAGVSALALVVVGALALVDMHELAEAKHKLYRHPVAVSNAVLAAETDIVRMQRSMKDVALAKTPEAVDVAARAVDAAEAKVFASLALAGDRVLGSKALVQAVETAARDWKPIRDSVIALKKKGMDVEAASIEQQAGTVQVDRISQSVNVLRAAAEAQSQALLKDSDAAVRAMTWVFVATIVVVLVGTVGLVMWVSTSITRPLASALRKAEGVAAGDLTERNESTTRDETGRLLRVLQDMTTQLAAAVGSVRANSESVATASAQIAQGNQDLSRRTEQQASALQETAATMEELSSTVRNNADSARQANQLAQGASAVAVQGGEVVGRVVNMMGNISESSRRIGDIISVIDDIAFQTNILALNAAVEAARAGEQGRGFAVVASEVRGLAQRSAEAAREIKALIGQSVEQVEQGTALVDEAGKTMGDIVQSIRCVGDIVAEISSACAEQNTGIQQVGQAVTQMDQATQQNAALVEESAAAAESLRSQAQQLVHAVAVFRLASSEGSAGGSLASLCAPVDPSAAQRGAPVASTWETQDASSAPRRARTPPAQTAQAASAEESWSAF
jgi:methyl-accepting chemotaxis protein